jgi:hypothetical protein
MALHLIHIPCAAAYASCLIAPAVPTLDSEGQEGATAM